MTFVIVFLLGAGALLIMSAIEDVSLADSFHKIINGELPNLKDGGGVAKPNKDWIPPSRQPAATPGPTAVPTNNNDKSTAAGVTNPDKNFASRNQLGAKQGSTDQHPKSPPPGFDPADYPPPPPGHDSSYWWDPSQWLHEY